MQIKFITALALVGAVLSSHVAQADGAVRVRYGIANNDYTVTSAGVIGDGTAAASYGSTNVGLTVISAGGAYFDAVVGSSEDGAKYKGDPNWFGQAGNFERSDTTLTIGATAPNADGSSAAFFFGYKSGDTKLKQGATATVLDHFETSGFFFGMSYGFPVAGGHFGLNGAMSFMSGTWSYNIPVVTADADFTIGFSLGANYTYMFNSSLGMSVEAKYNSYTYDFLNNSGALVSTVDETITSVGLNLFAQF